jgi:guanylate kinase
VLYEIDVNGARAIRERHPDAVLVFVDAPSEDDLVARLRRRGESAERIEQRLAKAEDERAAADELGMHRLVNDDLERALGELEALIARARQAS